MPVNSGPVCGGIGTRLRHATLLCIAGLGAGLGLGQEVPRTASDEAQSKRVDLRALLVEKAQTADASFILVSSPAGGSPRWSGRVDLASPFQAVVRGLGLEERPEGGFAWLVAAGDEGGEPGVAPRAHLARWGSSAAPAVVRTQEVVRAAQASLAQAFMCSLTEQQKGYLARPWHPSAIASAYDQFLMLKVPELINMGGFVDGSTMTEFQRRLCAALAFASPMGGLPLPWLATCSEIGFGDFQPAWSERAVWSPEVMVRSYQQPSRSISLRMMGSGAAVRGVSLTLPAHTLEGEELSALVRWAKENLPRTPAWEPVPNFTCKRLTDGPTRSLTDLVDLDEANLQVRIPEDLPVPTFSDLLECFRPYGYKFLLPPVVAQERPVVTSDPERADGVLTFLTALNSVIDDRPDRLWKREGNTFALVYEKWSDTEYAEDPRPWLDASLLGKPVTLLTLEMELPQFIAEIRKQTGASLTTSSGLEGCKVWLIARLKDVPLGDILATLGPRLGTAWERGNAGEVVLTHPDFLRPERSSWIDVGVPVRPEEWQRYRQTVACLAVSLLLETLPADIGDAEVVGSWQMPEIGRHLLRAACQVASGVAEVQDAGLGLVLGGVDEEGRHRAGLRIDSRIYTVAAIAPPTIPPNPLSPGYLVATVMGKPRVRVGPRGAPPGVD